MEKNLIIIGAGDFGREIMYAGIENNPEIAGAVFKTIAFIDEDAQKIGKKLEGVNIISFKEVKNLVNDSVYFINGTGNPETRKSLTKKLLTRVPQAKIATIIHASVIVMPNTIIDQGVFIAPNTTIAIGCHLKAHAVVNQNVSIGHDCIIEEFSVISPGCILSGRTLIGGVTFLGSGVITYPGIKIGNQCVLSAGTTVSRDLKENHKLIQKPNAMILPRNIE